MNKTLLNIKIEPTFDIYSIGFMDMSYYQNPSEIIAPSFEITTPIYSTKVSLPFFPQKVNIYRSQDLKLNCEEDKYIIIPDGVYTVKYSVFPSETYYVEKSFYRIDNLICKFEEKFLEIDLSFCNCDNKLKSKLKNKLREIRMLIESLIAASNVCDFKKADYIYKYIIKSLHEIGNCECN